MTSIIKLTVLSGAKDESPPCYLLQIDEFNLLLDCGWNEHLKVENLETLKKYASQIDCVLLSYPDITHLGALPYLVGKLGVQCPVYATIPVFKMGQMFLYDWYQSHRNSSDFDIFTLDDVDSAFDRVIQLKYSQHVPLEGKGRGLTIIPYAAGHMIGGTIWKIIKDGEDDILYAVDYNHKKERHLDGAVLETLGRPMLLITDAFNALTVQARRKERDQALLNNILSSLRSGGNVLVTVDTAGRVLELCQLLDQLWRNQDSGLSAYSLALLSNVSYNVIEFAKSQVEWMSDKIMRALEDQRNNPFQFKHLVWCHSLADLARIPGPKAVLATLPDLECGFARDLFLDWSAKPQNSIIFTQRTSPGSLARRLIDDNALSELDLQIRWRVRLEGEELEEFRRRQAEEQRTKAMLERRASTIAADDDEDAMSNSSDEEGMDVDEIANMSGRVPPGSLALDTTNSVEVAATPALKTPITPGARKGHFFKQHRSYLMFPCVEEKVRWDEYGQVIRVEDYAKFEAHLIEDKLADEVDNGIKEEAAEEEEEAEIPTKCLSRKETVQVRCRRQFIDFEGRSDGESIKHILSRIKPRQLILIHGPSEATEHLLDYCQQNKEMQVSQVWAPTVGETVDATCESHIYQARLKDSLVTSLNFTSTKDMELAWVDAQIEVFSATPLPGSESTSIQAGLEAVPTLDVLPAEKVEGHISVFINEPRLSDFKQVLTRAGISAEFSGGVLVCNDVVAVRKNESGRIGLEGALCDDYYRVRDLLYQQYAIV